MLQEREDIIRRFEAETLRKGQEPRKGVVVKEQKDGSKYEGQLGKGEVKEGQGIYFYTNNDVYLGEWREDKFEGKGSYLFANGERYQGQLKGGVKHGQGEYLYINGNVYRG